MKGTSGTLPIGDGWVHEVKWDGMRIVAHLIADGPDDGPTVRLQSGNGRNVTSSFPELASLTQLVEGFDSMVLDGEVIAFADGKPDFHTLQFRMHVSDPADAAKRAATTPVVYVVFDLLHVNGLDTMSLPLTDRRRLLEQTVDAGPSWHVCEQHDDGAALLDAVTEAHIEGVVSKRRASTYSPGKRSNDWVKIKPRQRQEFVVVGWMGGRRGRSGRIGSLLLGYYDDAGTLSYAGSAGSGLDDRSIDAWAEALTEQADCPLEETPTIMRDGRPLHWAVPNQVVEIAFGEWPEGAHVRHPVVLGRRTDKNPADIVREAP